MTTRELAQESHYSTFHFCRVFAQLTGMPLMEYVTKSKLQYELYDLCRGKKVIDVAVE